MWARSHTSGLISGVNCDSSWASVNGSTSSSVAARVSASASWVRAVESIRGNVTDSLSRAVLAESYKVLVAEKIADSGVDLLRERFAVDVGIDWSRGRAGGADRRRMTGS